MVVGIGQLHAVLLIEAGLDAVLQPIDVATELRGQGLLDGLMLVVARTPRKPGGSPTEIALVFCRLLWSASIEKTQI